MRMHIDWRGAGAVALCAWVLTVAVPARCAATDGTVTLDPASVAASGISLASLVESRYVPQVQGIAMVLDPQPLLALAAHLQSAQAAMDAAAVQVRVTAAEARRLRGLYDSGQNVALREVQAAAAAEAAAHSKRVAAVADYAAARSIARAQWGKTLAAQAGRGVHALDDYADGRAALLAIALPAGTAMPVAGAIGIEAQDGEALHATLLGPSPRVDAVVQGPTYFYRVAGAGLRIGQRLSVAVPLGATARSGVIVPVAAVLWYAGQPWAYVETAAGHFQRRPLAQDARTATGWFQASGFHAGERVVVRGGELLLSQELLPPPGSKPVGDGDD